MNQLASSRVRGAVGARPGRTTGRRVRIAAALLGLIVAAAPATPGSAPHPTEADVRAMLGVPANARLRYLADDGAPLTFEAFSAHVPRAPFDVRTDAATHEVTLQFLEVGGQREIGAVTRLPPLDAMTLDGRRVGSADFAGQLTFVNFFFSTCVACVREIPMLAELRRRHPELRVLAVTPDAVDEARAFARKRHFDWPIVADAQDFIRATRVSGYPTWLLVSHGRVIGRGMGLGDDAMRDPALALDEAERWIAARRGRQEGRSARAPSGD